MRERLRAVGAAAQLAAAFLIAFGCSAVSGGLSANRRSPGVLENGAFKPSRPPAAHYGPDPSLTCPDHGVNAIVDDELKDTKARPDGRLCAVAETLLGWEGEQPPENVKQMLSTYFGLPQPVRRVTITTVDTPETKDTDQVAAARQLAPRLVEPIRSFADTAQAPRYGVMTQRVKKGVTKVVLVTLDETVELQPLPKKLNPGQTAPVVGQVTGNLSNPKVQISDATGKLEQPKAAPGKAFQAELKCGDRPGRMLVQVSAEQGGGEMAIATFAVGCGTDLPQVAQVSTSKAGPVDPAQAEQRIAELMNQDRAAAGLPPLQVDPNLSKVARSVSDDRAQNKATSSGDLTQRLKDADVSASSITESAQQSVTPEEAYQSLSDSPAERATLMGAGVNQVGIGVAKGPVINDRPTIIVTELYAKQLPPPDADAIKSKLYAGITQKHGGLRKDDTLASIAQKYAEAEAANKGQIPKAEENAIVAPLYKGYRTVNIFGGPTAQEGAEFIDRTTDTKATVVGIGTAVGTSPALGKNTPFVVILLGTKAEAAKAPQRRAAGKKK